MKITQITSGYCDPQEYGVVVAYEIDRKEHSLYVEFNRKTRELIALRNVDPASIPPSADFNAIESAAREYVGNGWDA